ncbi:MAG TPA: glycosyltransferase family 87 protein [Terriglobales bacterium]|nr:glycosyltransferase family 87 protein [Terriglobales bacterium]
MTALSADQDKSRAIASLLVPAALLLLMLLNLYMTLPTMILEGSKGGADYSSFYIAGRTMATHNARFLYDYNAQNYFQQQIFGRPNNGIPYIHAPYEALLFALFAPGAYTTSYYAWACFNVGLLIVSAALLAPFLAISRWRGGGFALLCAAAFAPVGIALLQGQDSILVLTCMAAAYYELKKKRDLRAGCWLALAVFKWHLVAPVVIVWMVQRRWSAVRGFILVAAALGALSLAVVGVDGVRSYIALLRLAGEHLDMPNVMPTVRGLWSLVVPSGPVLLALSLAAAVGLLAFPLTTPVADDRGSAFDLNFALTVTVAILGAYHVYLHDVSVLWLPLLLVANFLYQERRWAPLSLLGLFFLIQVYIRALGPARVTVVLAVAILLFVLFTWREARRLAPAQE